MELGRAQPGFLRSRQFLYYFISLGCQDKNGVLGLKYREQKRIKMQKERVEMMEFELTCQSCLALNLPRWFFIDKVSEFCFK